MVGTVLGAHHRLSVYGHILRVMMCISVYIYIYIYIYVCVCVHVYVYI